MVLHKCEYCEYSTKNTGHLKQHLSNVHDIDVKWFECEIKECDRRFKLNGDLKRHLAHVHDIGVKWFECDFEECDCRFKRNSHLKTHLAFVHDIGVEWFECEIENCEYKSKQNSDLKRHLADVHDIDVKWFECEIKECDYRCKHNGTLKKHLANIHDIDVKWFECNFEDCNFKFKQKGHLKRHSKIHDPLYITRQKSKETHVYNFLTKHYDVKREHSISFECFESEGRRCRIDFLIQKKHQLFFIECDEYQHRDYPLSCENRRISDILTALTLSGNTLPICMIRFNPDSYKINNKQGKVKLKKRYNLLKEYIDAFESNQPFSIKFMFYDEVDGRPMVLDDYEFDTTLEPFVLI